MAHSNITGATATVLCIRLDSLRIELSLPNAFHQGNEKDIKILVDDKVEWSLIPLSSIVQISLIGKHHILHHPLGSYSGRVIDFLLDQGHHCRVASSEGCGPSSGCSEQVPKHCPSLRIDGRLSRRREITFREGGGSLCPEQRLAHVAGPCAH
ncbi:hypothetical protein BDN67DRAFT_971003 [Paxillus ammoniavirescens]|nr:hypothetical protein BDN67DRAFT_971003 [Paxillus ammoniavirescens]